MREYIEQRVLSVAEYILDTRATVRQTAKQFRISKSTVHKDMSERLRELNPQLFVRIREIMEQNREERHIRGGIATHNKYKNTL